MGLRPALITSNGPSSDAMFPNMRPAHLKSNVTACTVVVDAEEDFDWENPIGSTRYTTGNMENIRIVQEILRAYRLVPTYLLTYPILDSPEAVHTLRRYIDRGECEVGVQLHPWVTPPLGQGDTHANSFPGNLALEIEERKLVEMKHKFESCFGSAPRMYRAGRYGLGPNSATLLSRHGFTIDTSLAPRTSFADEGGPDFAGYGYGPFWFGADTPLLEVPLCRDIVGWTGRAANAAYQTLSAPPFGRLHGTAIASRLRLAERITLSPEGNDLPAMRRLAHRLHQAGQRLFVISFHSSSLVVGNNPYVRTKADMHAFYDRLSGILDEFSSTFHSEFCGLSGFPAYLADPGP